VTVIVSIVSKGVDKKQITEKINDLKKEIKSLTAKLKYLYNPTKKNQKLVQQDSSIQQQKRFPLPKGAKNSDDGLHLLDLQITDLKKQNDLFHAKMQKRQENLDKLQAEYQKLHTYKKEKTSLIQSERPPETQEEDQNRKVRRFNTGHITTYCHQKYFPANNAPRERNPQNGGAMERSRAHSQKVPTD
jgi:FtsZ-binding cell division protein ZapB